MQPTESKPEAHAAKPAKMDHALAEAHRVARGPNPQTKLNVHLRVSATVDDAKAAAVKSAAETFLKACEAQEVEVRGGADAQLVYAEPPPRVEKEEPVYYTRPDNPEPVPSQRMPNPPPSPEPHPLVGPARVEKK